MDFFTIGAVVALGDPSTFRVIPDDQFSNRYKGATYYADKYNQSGTRYEVAITITLSDYYVLEGYRLADTSQAIKDHRGISLGTRTFRIRSAAHVEGTNNVEVVLDIHGEPGTPAKLFTIGDNQVVATCEPLAFRHNVEDRATHVPVIGGTYLEDLGVDENGQSYDVTLILTNADCAALWAWRMAKHKPKFVDHRGIDLGNRAFRIRSSTYVEGCDLRVVELEILRG